jgi:hypothetical protein
LLDPLDAIVKLSVHDCRGGTGVSITAVATIRPHPIATQEQIDRATIVVAKCDTHAVPEVVGDPSVATNYVKHPDHAHTAS